jgi:hypothetical protein
MPSGLDTEGHSQWRRNVGAILDAFRDEGQHTMRLGSKNELVHVHGAERPCGHLIAPHEGRDQAVEDNPRRVRP